MNKALLFALLVIGSLATNSEFAEFAQIDKTEFGKTLFDTVALQLEAKAPVDSLVHQLAYIENQLISDQRKADSAHQAFQDKCDEEIRVLEAEIAAAEQKQNDLEHEIEVKKGILEAKRKRKAALEASIRDTLAELARRKKERHAEAAEFSKRVAECEYATNVINAAKRMFDKTFSSKSFLQTEEQTNSCFAEVSETFLKESQSEQFQVRKSFGSIFKVLATILASKKTRRSGMVSRIYKIFGEIIQKIEDTLSNERRSEDKRIQAYKKAVAQLNDRLAHLRRQLATVNAEIIALVNRIKEATQELYETRLRIVRKTRELHDKQRECDDEAEAYKTDREKRDVNKNTVSTLIGLIQSKLRRIRSYVKSRK